MSQQLKPSSPLTSNNNYESSEDAPSSSGKHLLLFYVLALLALLLIILGVIEAVIDWALFDFHVLTMRPAFFLWILPIWNVWSLPISGLVNVAIALALIGRTDAAAVLLYIWGAMLDIRRSNVPGWATIQVQKMTDDDTSRVEESDELRVFLQHARHTLLLGSPGAGKTVALRVYQRYLLPYVSLRQGKKTYIPIYISLGNYSATRNLSTSNNMVNPEAPASLTLLNYIPKTVKNVFRMQPPLERWEKEGRLLLLCDAFNEVNFEYQEELYQELLSSIELYDNRVIITCREIDYSENKLLQALSQKKDVEVAFIKPFEKSQQDDFIRSYIKKEYTREGSNQSNYDPEEVIRFIDERKFRAEYTSPLILRILIEIYYEEPDKDSIVTYGQLLRKYALRLIEVEQNKLQYQPDFTPEELLLFLGEIACAARRLNCRNAIQLGTALSVADQAKALQDIIQQVPPEDATEDEASPAIEPGNDDLSKKEHMLAFARGASLIYIKNSILRFEHEILAEYFVAEHLHAFYEKQKRLPYAEELMKTEANWSEPIRILAGFLEDAHPLAQHLAELGQRVRLYSEESAYNALTLGMMSLGVHHRATQWSMPRPLEELLAVFVSSPERQKRLAGTITRLAREVGETVYRPLLKVLFNKDVDVLLLQYLPRPPIRDLLFEHLEENIASLDEREVTRLEHLLGKMGPEVEPRALELSKPTLMQSVAERKNHKRIRKAAMRILGDTGGHQAVYALIDYLDEDEEMRVWAVKVLKRMSPDFASARILHALHTVTGTTALKKCLALLEVIEAFLQAPPHAITHGDITKRLMELLTYPTEIAEKAEELLFQESHPANHLGSGLLNTLIVELGSSKSAIARIKKILKRHGSSAVKPLLQQLRSEETTVPTRCHIVEVLGDIHDYHAVGDLLALLTASGELQKQVIAALRKYDAPFIVPRLISIVLSAQKEDEARAAAETLKGIRESVPEIADALRTAPQDRTQLLLEILRHVKDERALPRLIEFLRIVEKRDAKFIIELVETLAIWSDERIVEPFCDILVFWDCPHPVYQTTMQKISELRTLALPGIFRKLETVQAQEKKNRLLQSILGMKPFPNDMLLNMLGACSETGANAIMLVLGRREQAAFLIKQLCHTNSHIRSYVQKMVQSLDADAIVEPLLELLSDNPCYDTFVQFLRKYPDEAIPGLAELLKDEKRGRIAQIALLEFGPLLQNRLHLLLPAFNEPQNEKIQMVFIEIIGKAKDLLPEAIHLFRLISLPDMKCAYERTVEILSTSLVAVSISSLKRELVNDDHFIAQGVVKTLIKIGREQAAHRDNVIQLLIEALYTPKSRPQAENALIGIGSAAAEPVYTICFDEDPQVCNAARTIVSRIAHFEILYADLNGSDEQRYQVAADILVHMDAQIIVSPLVQFLASQDWKRFAQGLTILQRRFHAEEGTARKHLSIVSVLLEYIHKSKSDHENLSILLALLLTAREALLTYLAPTLLAYNQPQRWLVPLFQLLVLDNGKARETLIHLVQSNSNISHDLYGQLISTLGLLEPHQTVVEHARTLSRYLQVPHRIGSQTQSLKQQSELDTARRALGSLLASGQWSEQRLREFQNDEQQDSIRHEFFSVLLGEFYAPLLVKLREQLKQEQDTHAQLQRDHQALVAINQQKLQENADLHKEVDNLRDLRLIDEETVRRNASEIEVLNQRLKGANGQITLLASQNKALQQMLQEISKPRTTSF